LIEFIAGGTIIDMIRRNWMIGIAGISLILNGVAGYLLFKDAAITETEHEKSYIKQLPLDYERFKSQWGDAWIGVEVGEVTSRIVSEVMIDRAEGALITSIVNGSPAQKADIEAGNVILSFNGRKIRTAEQFLSDLAGSEVGDEIYICVANQEYRTTVYIVPEQSPTSSRILFKVMPYLGIEVSDIVFGSSEEEKVEEAGKSGGVLVEKVLRNSPAEKAGLQVNDIIMSFNDRKTRTLREFLTDLAGADPRDIVRMCIISGDVRKTIYVTLERTPQFMEI
jgi:S1-C subfamily serine protease